MRFIPAGAGNTCPVIAEYCSRSVYPRWRGEHSGASPSLISPSGLSPLARGTLVFQFPCKTSQRFIPAGAGNTPRRRCFPEECPVYPRWRGEHVIRISPVIKTDGLSPLARGTHRHASWLKIMPRFIPAGAGNTRPIRALTTNDTVYPRWRGEHFGRKKPLAVNTGLSPLARGTQQPPTIRNAKNRFIPAGAGNTTA